VNADLIFLLALQQACREGIVCLHYLSCCCSVVPLHIGSPYSGCGLARQIGAQVRPVSSYKMGLTQHCCALLSLVQHARVDSGLPPSTSSCPDSLRSLTPAGCELKSSPSPPLLPTVLCCRVMFLLLPLLPLSVSRSMNSFGCLQ
jgi:hypothetical protein